MFDKEKHILLFETVVANDGSYRSSLHGDSETDGLSNRSPGSWYICWVLSFSGREE